jgi:hypothetical protein
MRISQYADWLYDGKSDVGIQDLAPSTSDLEVRPDQNDSSVFSEQSFAIDEFLAKLYIFGEKVLDAKFCNTIISGFVENATAYLKVDPKFAAIPDVEIINALYGGTAAGSPIRKFLVDICMSQCTTLKMDEEYDPQYIRDLLQGYMKVSVTEYTAPGDLPTETWFKKV